MARPRRTGLRRLLDKRAEIGIGTMIVFIASVLVAAIAAGVLIETSGKLQERSQRTGNEATQQVSSNLRVENIVGGRDSASEVGLQDIEIYVSLAPGASEIDLKELLVQFSNGSALITFSHIDNANPGAGHFNATDIRDADGSFSSAFPVLTSGDLVKIWMQLDANNAEYEPRDRVDVLILPEIGAPIATGFTTPNSYGTDVLVALQ